MKWSLFLVYSDCVAIISMSAEELMRYVTTVLIVLQKAAVKFKLCGSLFLFDARDYFGVVTASGQFCIVTRTIDTVRARKILRTMLELQSILEHKNVYRQLSTIFSRAALQLSKHIEEY